MCKTRLSPAESYPGARRLTTAYQVAIDSFAIGTKTDKLSYVCLSVGRLTPFSASSYQPPASNSILSICLLVRDAPMNRYRRLEPLRQTGANSGPRD